ncbi:MAG: hypothetical protein B6I20_04370 [Bacteroidetes bacterium 4572_117]|nr:MAG: hypothetical protein B6I20_04370 [Bacteroidetes bacterium 4572_117]
MAKVKKFGAFSGVFTPSILTILGVIMYLRLGWVVGEGGLLVTLAIIIIAHIISVSTGLSISSIATDKKIKTGGIYYILSRSLGMAMGGAIGIALFIGTALSISLYIVGFTESFLGIEPIANFLGMSGTVGDIRIIGTFVIIVLVTLALISTSVVIKTQYFILGAIFLSLLSIAIGLFTYVPSETEGVLINPSSNDVTFEFLFAIFFPAVTGFTAGVAMSGDLKNPGKDIPLGTLASIIVGFLVYIFLAVGLAMFIDRDLLLNNSNFLITIAWFSPLVVIGVWGATLSSALGGILGGPRILQAIANDKIMPSFLGKGYGVNNEPRNALLFIFIIAEIGILVGDLNMIAGIVSMFYLASYGFINLAYALESFASTDFRPSFRISKWFGVVGGIASFAVMFKMDATAMTLALLIMTGIYLFLKRKELKSDFGDVWISVWNSIARSALQKMDKNKIEDRNWQPNILLFSGSTAKRPHLVDFGKNLVGKFGVVSNFDLIENKTAKYLFPKHGQSLSNDSDEAGIFYRRQTCNDIYQGIEIIASTYGFSGMEPNTILMGWSKQSTNPEKFINLIKSLYELDLNVLLMDYDKKRGFGKKASIDIWWRGEGQNNNLALFLAKFLMASPDWENAKLRLISISEFDQQGEQLHKKASYVLDILRINAEITIINNQYNKKDVFDIIKEESVETDLIFMGLPEIEKGNENKFVDGTNRLLSITGTVVLVKASSIFQKMIFMPDNLVKITKLDVPSNITDIGESFENISLNHNLKQETHIELKNLFYKLNNLAEYFSANYISPATNSFTGIQNSGIKKIENICITDYKGAPNDFTDKKSFLQVLDMVNNFADQIIDSLYKIANSSKELQEKAIAQYRAEILKVVLQAKNSYKVQYELDEIDSLSGSTGSERNIKRKLEVKKKLTGKAKLKINHKKILANQLGFLSDINMFGYFAAWFSLYFDSLVSTKELFRWFRFSLPNISEVSGNNKIAFGFTADQQNDLAAQINKILNINNSLSAYPKNRIPDISSKVVNDLASLYAKPDVNIITNMGSRQNQEVAAISDRVSLLTDFWQKGYIYFLNELKLDNALTKVTILLYDEVLELRDEISQLIEISLDENINKLLNNTDLALEHIKNHDNISELKLLELQVSDTESIRMLFNEIKEQSVLKLKTLHGFIPEKSEITENFSMSGLFSKEHNVTTRRILSKKLVDELIANDIIAEIYSLFDLLTKQVLDLANELINHNRLIGYSVDSESGMHAAFDKKEEDLIKFLKTKKADILGLKQKTKSLSSEIGNRLEKSYLKLNNKLQLFNFKKEADSWNPFLPKTHTIKGISWLSKYYTDIKEYFDKQLEQFWHKQSNAIILAESLKTDKDEHIAPMSNLIKLTAELSIKPDIKQNLPFYYKHLFLNKEFFNTDFWFGRKNELNRALSAWDNFKNGISGALMVIGERNSGKSFFIHKFISGLPKNTNVLYLKTYFKAQVNLKSFNKALRNTTGINAETDKIFKQLDENTVLVIDDVELLWQKSKNGELVINLLNDLIGKFGHKIFFILSQNIHSTKIINQIVPLSSLMIDIINLKPFSSDILQKLILFRHNSTGIRFIINTTDKKYKGKKQNEFKAKNYAKMFHKFFTLSNGNVGMALSYWIANIVKYNGEQMFIRLPKRADSKMLDLLTTDQLIILSQFVWHKMLSKNQLSTILLDKDFKFVADLEFLEHGGLIVLNNNNKLEINTFVYPQIIEKLVGMGYL